MPTSDSHLSKRKALSPFGKALLDYWNGDKTSELMHEFKDGRKYKLPISVFFRSPENFFPIEMAAMARCKGRILHVGAGTGRHALQLQENGFELTAIDICPEAVDIMKERGIKDVRTYDFFEFDGELYDTILLLGQNIGISESLNGLNRLLHKCKILLRPGGQILANSVQESSSKGLSSAYPGELEFRLMYKDMRGSWMKWLHIDYETLDKYASRYGWIAEKLTKDESPSFLAKLQLMES